jgi:phosphatidylinositol kinase/protein kinase (PI-3  family)
MRQDAVMQQFFALINNVLQESPDTQKRKLRIVTYKVHVALMLLLSVLHGASMSV